MTEAVLAVRQVSKTFEGQRVLSDVDLDIRRGEVHALVGENGSGKSTLIKILAGYYAPDADSHIAVARKTLALGNPEESRRLGLRFVHQDLGLIDQFTALENFGLTSGYPVRSGAIDWRSLRATAMATLARVGVDIDLDRDAAELTAVQRTGLAIARALDDSQLGRPRVLILDEPTAALPIDDVERLLRMVRDVAAQGVAVLYVSHRLDEVIALSDRITAIRDGVVVDTVETAAIDRTAVIRLIVGQELQADDAPAHRATDGGHTLSVRDARGATLRGVSFDVSPGEILGIAGLDGSGRELIARTLVGSVGSITRLAVDADPVRPLRPETAARAGIALVLANRDLAAAVRGMTVAENISHVTLAKSRRILLRSRSERSRVGEWIRRLDIRPADPTYDYTALSGGNRQKVILAKWLDIAPRVMVLDDPTSGVDVGARRSMYARVRDVAAGGVPVVVASSDLEDLARLCSRVLVLAGGTIAAELTGADLSESKMTDAMVRARSGGER